MKTLDGTPRAFLEVKAELLLGAQAVGAGPRWLGVECRFCRRCLKVRVRGSIPHLESVEGAAERAQRRWVWEHADLWSDVGATSGREGGGEPALLGNEP